MSLYMFCGKAGLLPLDLTICTVFCLVAPVLHLCNCLQSQSIEFMPMIWTAVNNWCTETGTVCSDVGLSLQEPSCDSQWWCGEGQHITNTVLCSLCVFFCTAARKKSSTSRFHNIVKWQERLRRFTDHFCCNRYRKRGLISFLMCICVDISPYFVSIALWGDRWGLICVWGSLGKDVILDSLEFQDLWVECWGLWLPVTLWKWKMA